MPSQETPSSLHHTHATAKDIAVLFKVATAEELPALLERYAEDPRQQVASARNRAIKRLQQEETERLRVAKMYEEQHSYGGNGVVVGVDEVGRGAVAGPLTVAAVVLPSAPLIYGLNDSKKLSPAKREELAREIRSKALAIGVAHVEADAIDACGMAASLRVAVLRALDDAGVTPDAVLIDGNPLNVHDREVTIVGGDGRIACIAAASIVAKVTRDALMVAYDTDFPGYGFAQSKGYASPDHIAAIQKRGLSRLHRKTFCQGFSQQESLF